MKKYVLALLLCLSVFASSAAPATMVYAQDTAERENTESAATLDCVNHTDAAPLSSAAPDLRRTNGPAGTDNPGVETSKTVKAETDGSYTLRLESYVTGSSTTTEEQKPTDTVLVLDTSGSMDDYIDVADKDSVAELDPRYADYYKWKSALTWRDMRYENGVWEFDSIVGWKPCGNSWFGNNAGIKKIDALRIAANGFIESTAENGGDHRIAIVTYESNSDIENQPTDVSTGADVLKSTINGLEADGATAADYGMQNAKNIIEGIDPKRESNKAVIMFTDGEPNHGNNFNTEVANDTIAASKAIKAMDTTVYTIGVVKGADPTADISGAGDKDINKYLHYVSSNYPGAESMTNGGSLNPLAKPFEGGKSYYLSADNLQSLSDIFESIRDEIGGASVTLGTETVVRDVISDYFRLPAGAGAGDITVKTADCISFDGDTPVWEDEKETSLTVAVDGKTVSVSGFDFSENWVGKNATTGAVHPGKKLIIEISIAREDGFIGGNAVPTNGGASGVYDEAGKLVENFEIPTADVPIRYAYAAADQTIFLGETADLTERLSHEAPYTIDGIHNRFVDIVYTLKTGGTLIGTYTISAGANSGVWNWENGQNSTPALTKTTDYDVTCTVTPTGKGTCEVLTVEEPDFTVYVKSGTLTIHKNGGMEGDKYVFNIQKDGEYYMTVTALSGGSVNITRLPKGTYTVAEETGWSWRWEPTYEPDTVTINQTNPDASVTCTNQQTKDQWLNGYNHKLNEKGGTQ